MAKRLHFTLRILILLPLLFLLPLRGEDRLQRGPVNPAFLEYQHYLEVIRPQTPLPLDRREERAGGVIPSPVWISPSYRGVVNPEVQQQTRPVRYDLRDTGRLTAVRDQGSYGTCWAFASFGSLESVLLPGETYNFSEMALARSHGFDAAFDAGGDWYYSAACMTRWDGPLSEGEWGYSPNEEGPEVSVPFKHLQGVTVLPRRRSKTDLSTVKYFLMNHGALYYSTAWDSSRLDLVNSTYYSPGNYDSGLSGHAVTIVGWDDHFSRDRFKTPPPGHGAFLCKNSWGKMWGSEEGFFYISYYHVPWDSHKESFVCFHQAEDSSNYSRVYSHDDLGWCTAYGYNDPVAWGGNRFIADSDSLLAAVGFYTVSDNNTVHIKVYTGCGEDSPTGFMEVSRSIHFHYAGYHTVELSRPVVLTSGRPFSVVIHVDSSPYTRYPLAAEYPFPGYSSGAQALARESYISPDGIAWEDIGRLENANLCIKAYTASTPVALEVTGRRAAARSWLNNAYYGEVTISVENDSSSASRFLVYRREVSDTGSYSLCGELSAGDLNNGTGMYYDKYIDSDSTYEYKVVALDVDGTVCGIASSDEI